MSNGTIRLIFILILFTVPVVNADPEWFSPNIKRSDCYNVFKGSGSKCDDYYNEQHITRIKQYIRNEIKDIDSEYCDNDQLLKYFEDREVAWNDYSSYNCEFINHCVGWCGSGHSSFYASCSASASRERLTFLENEVKNGINIYGCTIRSVKQSKILITENHEIVLNGKCDLGLFECDNITYKSIDKNNGNETFLTGSVLMELDERNYIDMPVGYVFVNGGVEYQIMNSGLLKVIDNKNRKTLFEEKGKWK